jgi:predicted DCC family thiol-disulfide oxidoreductase YuxK
MAKLKNYDHHKNIAFADIGDPATAVNYPHIDLQQANSILHVEPADGPLLLGLDATHAVWSIVGKGHRTGWLRAPIIKPIADRLYLLFAKHRYKISFLLTGRSRCQRCQF